MKLPSGREIFMDTLTDIAVLLGEASFYFDDMDEAVKDVFQSLISKHFTLNNGEREFEEQDAREAIRVVKPAASKLATELYKLVEEKQPLLELLVEKEIHS